jgi:hypothetical protein
MTDLSPGRPLARDQEARDGDPPHGGRATYTVCTIVTRPDHYAQMCASFEAHGFTRADTDYLYADNTGGNALDAFQACNRFLLEARSPYVIICHQDIRLVDAGRRQLDDIVADLDRRHPGWGLFGNAGAKADGELAIRITDPSLTDVARGGPFPVEVVSLDENFIVIRAAANLAVSHDMQGFHFYGADLCLIADILGCSAHVVDFHLLHHSGGTIDGAFLAARTRMGQKYRRAFRSRWVFVVTLRPFFVSGSSLRIFGARAWRAGRQTYQNMLERLVSSRP